MYAGKCVYEQTDEMSALFVDMQPLVCKMKLQHILLINQPHIIIQSQLTSMQCSIPHNFLVHM